MLGGRLAHVVAPAAQAEERLPATDFRPCISAEQFWGQLSTFARIAMIYVTTAVLVDFFSKHYIFRWRQAMNEHYMAAWPRLRHIEGAAQRVQEDTMRFARTMEDLGLSFMRSLMTLAAFLPVLWALSDKITELPLIGAVPHALVWVALAWSALRGPASAFRTPMCRRTSLPWGTCTTCPSALPCTPPSRT